MTIVYTSILPASNGTTSTGEVFQLPNGRGVICYHLYGDLTAPASTRTVFYSHGEPGSFREAECYDIFGKQRGFRVVGIDRPGMGYSTFQPGRRVVDWPADVLALADHLGAERFAVIGVSGGAPYVFACANEIPASRLAGCCVLAGACPADILGPSDPPSLEEEERSYAASVERARDVEHPERLMKALQDSFNRVEADREAWIHGDPSCTVEAETLRGILAGSIRRGLWGGTRAPAWDTCAILGDWGFKLENLVAKVQGLNGTGDGYEKTKLVIWHGRLDPFCRIEETLEAKELIPTADWYLSDKNAHLSTIFGKLAEAADTLDQMLR